MKNCLSNNIDKQLPKLNQGEGILTSNNLLKDLNLKIRKSNVVYKNESKRL